MKIEPGCRKYYDIAKKCAREVATSEGGERESYLCALSDEDLCVLEVLAIVAAWYWEERGELNDEGQ